MDNRIVIGVDTGNRCIKTKNFSFVSGLVAYNSQPLMTDEYVKYNGTYYALTNDRIAYMEDKTETEDFFILTLFAIAKELKHRCIQCNTGISICLAVGLPPAHIGRLKEKFIAYFQRGFVKFSYGTSLIVLNIKDVYLFPQGYSAILPYFDEVAKESKAYIVDIGGYTTDVIMLNKGMIDLQCCTSFDMGVIDFFNKLKIDLRQQYSSVPDEQQIEAAIVDKEELYKDMTKAINESAKRYAEYILKVLNESKINLMLSKVFFIGGGSLLFREFLDQSEYLNKKEYITDVSANAAGYEYLANMARYS